MFRDTVLSILATPIGATGCVYYDLLITCAIGTMAVGCYYEWVGRRLPNAIVGPALLLVSAFRFLVGGPSDWLIVGFIIWGYFFWTWTKGFIGAGDAKGMMVLTALWPAWWLCLVYLVWWGLTSGGLYSLWALVRARGRLKIWWAVITALPVHVFSSEARLPKREVLLLPGVISAALFYLLVGRTLILGGLPMHWPGILGGG